MVDLSNDRGYRGRIPFVITYMFSVVLGPWCGMDKSRWFYFAVISINRCMYEMIETLARRELGSTAHRHRTQIETEDVKVQVSMPQSFRGRFSYRNNSHISCNLEPRRRGRH